jgi:hypothetical protein
MDETQPFNVTTGSDLEVEVLARRAGLARALADHREDVHAAAAAAAAFTAGLFETDDVGIEPWPPMRVGTTA